MTSHAVVASALLLVLIGGAFAALVLAVAGLRDAVDLRRQSREVLVTANHLEKLVIDLETGQRGFLITGDERFLRPWSRARAAIPEQAAALERQAGAPRAAPRAQKERARDIGQAIYAYIRDYSVPTVEAARHDPASMRTVAVTEDGRLRLDAIRGQFDRFVASERDALSAHADRAAAAAHQATIAAVVGVAGSLLLVVAFDTYMIRSIVRPVHRASIMAGKLAAGDLSVRIPATGPGEIGVLEQAFSAMASNLEASRDELRRVADEQAALRRVATVVARAASPSEVFGAVAIEMGRILDADGTVIQRYEPDRTMTVVGSWSRPGPPRFLLPPGSRRPIEDESVSALVMRTGKPSRVTDDECSADGVSGSAGGRAAVGSTIVVEGRLWGVIIAFSADSERLPEGVEDRMLEFTELVATAIANTESRAELAASRARVVAAADESRRRIERNLHDGAQQRLISLGLELRKAEATVPSELKRLKEELSATASGLVGVVGELQELSRGLHPVILSKGGLAPALRALARRSAIPVELSMNDDRRMPEQVEVAAYYVASEALTNAAKHSHASVVWIELDVADEVLRLTVRDDGIGGADSGRGSGLIGLMDRVEAISGSIHIESPVGKGTVLAVTLPITRVDT